MKNVTLTLPTDRLLALGLFPERFFRSNESLEVLQAFRLGGNDLTLLVRIRRRGRGPTEREVAAQGAALRKRYGLKHFELLSIDRESREYTVLLRVSMTEGMGEMARQLGADLLPAQPCVVREGECLVSFAATDAQVRRVRELLALLEIPFTVSRARRLVSGGSLAGLTARQRDLLSLAHRLGYFESPARTDLARIASIAGVTKAAVSKHLRAAQRHVLASALVS
jgi:hypothetical protein